MKKKEKKETKLLPSIKLFLNQNFDNKFSVLTKNKKLQKNIMTVLREIRNNKINVKPSRSDIRRINRLEKVSPYDRCLILSDDYQLHTLLDEAVDSLERILKNERENKKTSAR